MGKWSMQSPTPPTPFLRHHRSQTRGRCQQQRERSRFRHLSRAEFIRRIAVKTNQEESLIRRRLRNSARLYTGV